VPHIRRASSKPPPQSGRIAAGIRRHVDEQGDSHSDQDMTRELIERSRQSRAGAGFALVALTLALVLALAIAAAVVSIGIARADTLGALAASWLLMPSHR